MTLAKECERMYITALMTGGSGVQAADATLYCIKITVNATDLFGTVEQNLYPPTANQWAGTDPKPIEGWTITNSLPQIPTTILPFMLTPLELHMIIPLPIFLPDILKTVHQQLFQQLCNNVF